MILEIDDLVAGYGQSQVLKGLSLSLGEGEILALLGRNGMGKTTLLRCLMGLIAPAGGEVLFDGRGITGQRPYETARQGIAYVPQGREIFAEFTVEENLMMGLIGQGRVGRGSAASNIPGHLFEQFPLLAERRRQKAGSLSGGQQQQLAIARALAPGPRLLLLDEPSEGIQPSIVQEIAKGLERIVEEAGLSVLLVEQNIEMALSIAGRCAFIEGGRIAAESRPEALRADPQILHRHLGL